MAKTRRCKYCKRKNITFVLINTAAFCNWDCAAKFGREKAAKDVEKAAKKSLSSRKKALTDNDKPLRTKEAQKAFNAFIRKRDFNLNCISCKRTNEQVMGSDSWKVGGAWDCGHFLTRGAFPELRFEELNAHKQCKSCNGGSNKYAKKSHLVAIDYRVNLIKKIGIDNVNWLEGPHKPKKYTCAELKEIELNYKAKLKELLP